MRKKFSKEGKTFTKRERIEKPYALPPKIEESLEIIPESYIISFNNSFEGVEGLIIEEESLKNFIEISPYARAYGKWISERDFEIFFKEELYPDKRYEIILKKLPIINEEIEIKKEVFTFTTPSLKVRNIYQKKFEGNNAVFQIEFNFNLKDIRDEFFEVFDSNNEKVKITDLRYLSEIDRTKILITTEIRKAPERYKIIIKRGLEGITLGGKSVYLKEDFEKFIPIGFLRGPILYESYSVEESDLKKYIKIKFSIPNEKYPEIPEIDDRDIEDYIKINPQIKTEITASNSEIYIFGDFIPEKDYEIIIKPGIKTKGGSSLQEEIKLNVSIPKMKDNLRFLYEGRYFGRNGEWKIPIKVSGIKEFNMNVYYIQPENVLFWHSVSGGSKYDVYHYAENILNNYKIKVENPSQDNIIWFDLREIKDIEKEGVYYIEINSEKSWELKDNIKIVITDISIIAKWSENSVYVWTINSQKLVPVPDVDIEIKTSTNFLVGKGKTDRDGFAKIEIIKKGREPYIIFGRKGEEWTYALLPVLSTPTEKFDISGEDPLSPYIAYIYPERNLYRPGEEVHFAVVVRENRTYKGVSVPVNVNITDPKGAIFAVLSGETDNSGIIDLSFKTNPSSPTGKYSLNLNIGNRNYYSYSIFVETFVPERISVNLKLPDIMKKDENLRYSIKADYLFGAPASFERYSGYYQIKEIPFTCEGDYRFGPIDRFYKPLLIENEISENELDKDGKADDIIPTIGIKNVNPLKVSLMVQVQEGGSGRTTSKVVEKVYHTKPFYIGLKSNTSRVISGKPIEIKGIIMKPDCNLYKNDVKLTYRIYRVSYYYNYYYDEYYDYDYDYDYWNRRIQKIPVSKERMIDVKDGSFSFSFSPPTGYSDLLVEVKDEENGTFSQILIYGWGWWWGDEEKVESPEILPIRIDKDFYDEDEVVKVEALLPFEGRIYWFVELDSIYYTKYEDVKGEIGRFSFRAPRNLSNVYVSALLVRSGEDYLVSRAYGIKKVRIRPERLKIPIDISTKNTAKPGEEVEIKIKGISKFEGTISIVDEGILQITNFKTPNIYEGILRDVRLKLMTAESFGWIIKRFLERTGGGYFMKEEEFPQPRFARIVSQWSGIIKSDENGNIRYRFKIPQYNGKLRIMVQGINEERFGSNETYIIVKSDVVVQPTIPRFAYTGDNFKIPVNLINTTKEKKKVRINIDIENGNIAQKERELELLPEENKTIFFDVSTGDEIGEMKIKIHARSGEEEFKDDFLIPVFPDVPYITEANYITIEPERDISLNDYLSDFYPKAHFSLITISSLPGITRLNRLKYAVHYPYGCIEQTSTSTLLLLRMRPFLNAITDIDEKTYIDMVNKGLGRIVSMQKISGGFTFWPGCEKTEDWASAYATFVLIEAKDAGFSVSKNSIDAALNYLQSLENKHGFVYYVLAKGGVLKRDMVDRLISLAKNNKFTSYNLLWIAGTLFESGKYDYARELLEEVLKRGEENVRRLDGDFYSPLQMKGLELYFVEKIMPQSSYETKLVIELMNELSGKDSYYYTTQEIAWSVLALGLYANRLKTTDLKPNLRVDGKTITPITSKNIYTYKLWNSSTKDVKLRIKGTENAYVCIENTGFSKKERKFTPYSNGILIIRNIYDYYGNPLNSAKVGDIVVFETEIRSDGSYNNVAIEIPVPAGIDIENPRLKTDILPQWAKNKKDLFNPSYIDVRDDRIIIFGTTYKSKLFYYFLGRATMQGEFFLPPAKGVVMYDPVKNASTESGSFKVIKK